MTRAHTAGSDSSSSWTIARAAVESSGSRLRRALVAGMLPKARVDALVEQLWKLEDLPEVAKLIQMTKL